jgi:hypothetical protein
MAQLAIDTKREELQRLEHLEREEEESLRRKEAEINLFRDQFRSFLETDGKATMEARNVAEKKAKERLEVAVKIKQISAKNGELRNAIAHQTDKLEEWSVYTEFLEKLTPPEWRKVHPKPEMYFKMPEQLIEIMKGLEEHNMFLVVHCQEAEDVLERYRIKFSDIIGKTDERMAQMCERRDEEQIALEAAIGRNEAYKVVGEFRQGNELGEAEMAELEKAILDFHTELGYDAAFSVDRVTMLTRIEKALERLSELVTKIDRKIVKEMTQAKNVERRDMERTEKNARDKREQDEKARRAIQLALMPIKRRTGKAPVRRMLPVKADMREKREEAMRIRQARAAADENLLYGELWD